MLPKIFLDYYFRKVRRPKNADVRWRISAYAVLISSKSEILIVSSFNHRKYEFPGGAVEIYEDISRGLKREVYEETGYRIQLPSREPFYVGESYFYHNQNKRFYHSVNLFYFAKLRHHKQNKKVINKYVPNEISEVAWRPLLKLNRNNTHHVHYPALKLLKNKS